MALTYLVTENQSIPDLTIIIYGTLDKMIKLVNDNGLSLTQNLVRPGTQLVYDNSFTPNKNRISTAPPPLYKYPVPVVYPGLSGSVILYPHMNYNYYLHTTPSVTGTYSFRIIFDGSFISTYGISSSWFNSNPALYTPISNIMAGYPVAPSNINAIVDSTMTDKYLDYGVPYTNTNPILYNICGVGAGGYSGDHGTATNARINLPIGVDYNTWDSGIYFSDSLNRVIRAIGAAGIPGQINTVSGNAAYTYYGDGILAASASFASPTGLVCDGLGQVYICDEIAGVVRKIDTAMTGLIRTIAGSPSVAGFSGDGGAAISSTLHYPGALCVDSLNNLYISDKLNFRIRKITHATGIITTVVGTGTASYTGDGGLATLATINQGTIWNTTTGVNPVGICCDSLDNLYIADYNNHAIRKVDVGTGKITTIAGTGIMGVHSEGAVATTARLTYPTAVAVDSSGIIYFCDNFKNVSKIVGGLIYTISVLPTAVSTALGMSPTNNLYICNGQYLGSHNNIYEYDPATASVTGDIWFRGNGTSLGSGATTYFRDTIGNGAVVTPAIILDGNGTSSTFIKDFLLGSITAEIMGNVGATATVKLTKSHPVVNTAGISYSTIFDNLTTYVLHPDPLGNTDIAYLYVPTGTYSVGVVSPYNIGLTGLGDSRIYTDFAVHI